MSQRSFTFNGYDFSGILNLRNLEKAIMPDQEPKTKEVPGRPGVYFIETEDQPITRSLEYTLTGQNAADLFEQAEELQEKIYTGGKTAPLVFHYAPHKTYQAVIVGSTPIEDNLRYGDGELNLFIPYPISTGEEKTELVSLGDATIEVTGNYKTFPIFDITIDGAGTYIEILNDTTGEKIRINRELLIDDVIKIDHKTEKITYNGETDLNVWDFTTKFFELLPGPNRIIVTSDGGETVYITYKEAWR